MIMVSEKIKHDLYRYIPKSFSLFVLISGLRIPGFFYSYILRSASKQSLWIFSKIFYKILHRKYTYKFGIQIPIKTSIGKGFYIGHFGNIIVSPKSIIGDYCNISQGVTIGAINQGKRKGAPTIGNFVWIGANAIIVGNIKIGSNVLIAPGAFVNFDVPDHSIVIGNPGKIISKVNASELYINNLPLS